MDDLISRQAAIDAAIEAADDWDGGCSKERERFIRDALEELPSAQPDLITKIQNGIKATDAYDVYSCGMRNGMRWCLSLIDDKEPLYENCPSAQPEQDILSWLLAYHTKSFDLHGRYMPHEVIGWLVHDFANAYMAERRGE